MSALLPVEQRTNHLRTAVSAFPALGASEIIGVQMST